MGQTASELRRELAAKRDELSHDVDRIEEKVKSTFDINRYVEENPLMATGVAILGGFLLGNMVGGGGREKHERATGYYSSGAYNTPQYQRTTYSGAQQHEAQQGGPGIVAGVKESFRRGSGGRDMEDTMSNVTAALTAILVDKAKEMLDRNLPGFSEKYEQAEHTRHQSQGQMGSGQERGASYADSTTGTAGSGYTGGAGMRDTSTTGTSTSYGSSGTTSGSEHLGGSSSTDRPASQ